MSLPCTAIILLHTDSAVLQACLRSVSWAEKIIIIDNDSQIPTQRLFDLGASEVFELSGPIQDFAAIRNLSLSQVTTPWCFFLDSDEVMDSVTPTVLSELRKLMDSNSTAGLTIKRSDIFLGKKLSYGEAGNQPLVRFMRPKNTQWFGRAHEKPVISGLIQSSQITITHYSHESINSFIVDVSQYAKIVATEKRSSVRLNTVQLVCYPIFKVMYDLIFLGAILDGWRGIIYSYCMSLHSLLVRIYWYEKNVDLAS